MQHDELQLDNCVKCSDCNAACPVAKVYPDYPGPKVLGPDMERFRREGVPSDTVWVDYCTGCHGCDVACPHGVNVSELIAKGKAQHGKNGMQAFRDHWMARPNVLGKLNVNMLPFSNVLLNLGLNRWLMSCAGHVTSQRELPTYHRETIRAAKDIAAKERVVFFPGCYIRYNKPSLGNTVVDLLRINGFSVEIAADVCCGMPATANGDSKQLMQCVEGNTAMLGRAVEQGALIVTACTSCSYALKADYAHIYGEAEPLGKIARKVASHTYDLAELLTALLDAGRLNTDLRCTPHRLAYHAPCHLKSQGVGRPWLRLLRLVPGLEVEEIKADCCGMAGTYGFKQEKYQISMDIGRELFEGIAAYDPEAVVTECGPCQMQIEHGTKAKAMHPAEVFHSAYDPLSTVYSHKGVSASART